MRGAWVWWPLDQVTVEHVVDNSDNARSRRVKMGQDECIATLGDIRVRLKGRADRIEPVARLLACARAARSASR